MFKKLWLFAVFLFFVSGIYVYAETWVLQTWSETPSDQIQAFNGLQARHCDQWLESLSVTSSLTLDATETKTLCNMFMNESDFPITIKYNYVESEIWDVGTPNCELNEWKFANLITIPESSTFTIPAHGNIVRYDKMLLRPGMSGWLIHWCLAYALVSVQSSGETIPMFKIQYRKVLLYNVLIGGQSKIENSVSLESQKSDVYITDKKIKVSSNNQWGITISAIIKNNGNVDQIITLTGKISNFLWFQKDISLGEKKIGPYQTLELPITIDTIPSYKWLFNFVISITHTPSLAFADFNLPAETLKWGIFYETWTFFVFSRYIIWVVILALLILWLLIKNILPKKK